jgi:hypothetical protein
VTKEGLDLELSEDEKKAKEEERASYEALCKKVKVSERRQLQHQRRRAQRTSSHSILCVLSSSVDQDILGDKVEK